MVGYWLAINHFPVLKKISVSHYDPISRIDDISIFCFPNSFAMGAAEYTCMQIYARIHIYIYVSQV